MRFSTRTLMLTVAIIAVAFAAFRIGVFAVILACISLLAWKRTSDGIGRGLATSLSQKTSLLLSSLVVAAVIIGLSDLAFLLGYHEYIEWAVRSSHLTNWNPRFDLGCIFKGIVAGAVLSLCVAAFLRKTIWPIKVTTSELVCERRSLTLARFIRYVAAAFFASYVAIVGILVLLKVTLSPTDGLAWTEVIYGPAISVGSCFILVILGIWVEHRIRRPEQPIRQLPDSSRLRLPADRPTPLGKLQSGDMTQPIESQPEDAS